MAGKSQTDEAILGGETGEKERGAGGVLTEETDAGDMSGELWGLSMRSMNMADGRFGTIFHLVHFCDPTTYRYEKNQTSPIHGGQ
jgi:hypothetical protein